MFCSREESKFPFYDLDKTRFEKSKIGLFILI